MFVTTPTMKDAVRVRAMLMDMKYQVLIFHPDRLVIKEQHMSPLASPWKSINLVEGLAMINRYHSQSDALDTTYR